MSRFRIVMSGLALLTLVGAGGAAWANDLEVRDTFGNLLPADNSAWNLGRSPGIHEYRFIVKNTAPAATVTITTFPRVQVGGAGCFSLGVDLLSPIFPGETLPFSIWFDSSGYTGTQTGTVHIGYTDSSGWHSYDFQLTVTVASGALMNVRVLAGAVIPNDETAPPVPFPDQPVGSTGTKIFSIENIGSEALSVDGVTASAPFSAAFSGSIPAGTAKPFDITFTPEYAITYTSTVTILYHDSHGSGAYRFRLTGTVPGGPIAPSGLRVRP